LLLKDFDEEQNMVAKLVHQLYSSGLDEQFAIYITARKRFASGGPRRLKHTLPPLGFQALLLVRRMMTEDSKSTEAKKVGPADRAFFFFRGPRRLRCIH
jgi:vacuolar protein sorting-associated protein 35